MEEREVVDKHVKVEVEVLPPTGYLYLSHTPTRVATED
jgi:hypothetical protein